MKKILALLSVVCLIASCHKPKPMEPMAFTLSASYDSTVTNANIVRVAVAKTSGDDDIVNLEISGLPGYITADFVPTGTGPFSTSISFKLSALADKNVSYWKDYTVTITATSSSGVVISRDVTFFCYPNDPTQAFDGLDFRAVEDCSPSGSNTRSISTLNAGGNRIILTDFFVTDIFTTVTLPAFVDGRKRTITIPPFTQDGYTFRGGGTFFLTTDGNLGCKIGFSRSSTGLFDTCSMQLTQFY